MKLVTKAELNWLQNTVMPRLGVKRITIAEDVDYRGKYPDIWAEGARVTVTREWARQSAFERKKRLVHEVVHVAGHGHEPRWGYYSRPERDRFSEELTELFLEEMPIGEGGKHP